MTPQDIRLAIFQAMYPYAAACEYSVPMADLLVALKAYSDFVIDGTLPKPAAKKARRKP